MRKSIFSGLLLALFSLSAAASSVKTAVLPGGDNVTIYTAAGTFYSASNSCTIVTGYVHGQPWEVTAKCINRQLFYDQGQTLAGAGTLVINFYYGVNLLQFTDCGYLGGTDYVCAGPPLLTVYE